MAGRGRGDRGGDPLSSVRLLDQPDTRGGRARGPSGGFGGERGDGLVLSPAGPRLGVVVPRPHALNGVLRGVLSGDPPPPRPCVTWGQAPHLWSLVAPAIGLRVVAGFGDPSYLEFLRSSHPGLRACRGGPPRKARDYKKVQAVLMDLASAILATTPAESLHWRGGGARTSFSAPRTGTPLLLPGGRCSGLRWSTTPLGGPRTRCGT